MLPGNKREDTEAKTSGRGGLSGMLETFLRRFRLLSYILALTPIYLLGIGVMGIAAMPGIWQLSVIFHFTQSWSPLWHFTATGISIVAAYFIYGFTLIFVIPLTNFLMPFRAKPFRGGFYSIESVPWYIHNALTYIVRYTFLELVTPTPFNPLFYRLMGMKIGKDVHINTTNISDPALIEIGDKVTIGGSAHILAHYASGGYVIVAPVKIGNGVTIGLKATIMGDVVIGDGAIIAPHEVVFPKSRIPAGRKPDMGNTGTDKEPPAYADM